MKAESGILTGVHRPMTFLGLPPALLGLAVGAAMAGALAAFMAGLPGVSLIAGIAMLTVFWGMFYRRHRRDHHFQQLMLQAPRFWKRRPERRLMAGPPPGRGPGRRPEQTPARNRKGRV